MAKRFTDSDKWKKVWFSELSPVHKCLWFYILDSCSTGGIWEPNWKRAAFDIKARLDVEKIKEVFAKQFVPIEGGHKWFIRDYITFQYGKLNPLNRAHKGAIEELQHYGLLNADFSLNLGDIGHIEGASKELASSIVGAKDKDKDTAKDQDKAKVKVKDKVKVKVKDSDPPSAFDSRLEFEAVWALYPKKLGRKEALGHFKATVRSETDVGRIRQALTHYLESRTVKAGDMQFVKYGSTWFNEWQDWENYTEPTNGTNQQADRRVVVVRQRQELTAEDFYAASHTRPPGESPGNPPGDNGAGDGDRGSKTTLPLPHPPNARSPGG